MKYIKSFEDLREEPKVGDYTMIKKNTPGLSNDPVLQNHVLNNIGIIIELRSEYPDDARLFVGWENPPDDINPIYKTLFREKEGKNYICQNINDEDILFVAKTKYEAELKLAELKYNL